MKAYIFQFTLLSSLFLLTTSFNPPAAKVNWLTWDEAIEKSKSDANPKKIFVDVYTDWCGWCKRMDAITFNNPEVQAYMEANFYMVKLNAEQREDIIYNDRTFKFIPNGRRGHHELAVQLLQGKMSYPSVVFLSEDVKIINIIPGFRQPKEFLKIASYIGDDAFKNTKWEDYQKSK